MGAPSPRLACVPRGREESLSPSLHGSKEASDRAAARSFALWTTRPHWTQTPPPQPKVQEPSEAQPGDSCEDRSTVRKREMHLCQRTVQPVGQELQSDRPSAWSPARRGDGAGLRREQFHLAVRTRRQLMSSRGAGAGRQGGLAATSSFQRRDGYSDTEAGRPRFKSCL